MNQITPPPKIEIIPSSAPFSEAQRSWLNGFFAGLLSDATPLSAEQGAAVMEGAAGDGDDGEAPWHDQTMPMADRMKHVVEPTFSVSRRTEIANQDRIPSATGYDRVVAVCGVRKLCQSRKPSGMTAM